MDQQIQTTNQSSQSLSKKERYFLKRQQKEIEFQHQIRRKKIKKALIICLPILIAVGITTILIIKYTGRPSAQNQNGNPKIEISPQEYELGDVLMAGGVVKKTFEIKNSGAGDLKIDNIWTSCHCTTAVLKVADKESPTFGMESGLSFWSQKIAPGETGSLEVIFDPAYHGPSGLGPAVRAVYLSTNNPENKQIEVRIIANVIR